MALWLCCSAPSSWVLRLVTELSIVLVVRNGGCDVVGWGTAPGNLGIQDLATITIQSQVHIFDNKL